MSSEIKVSSVKAKDGTAGISIADSTGAITANGGIANSGTITAGILGDNVTGKLTQMTNQSLNGMSTGSFTVPTTAKYIAVVFKAISEGDGSHIFFRIGTGGSLSSSGYTGTTSTYSNGATPNSYSVTNGLVLRSTGLGNAMCGICHWYNVTGNDWVGNLQASVTNGTQVFFGSTHIQLGGAINVIAIADDSNTFDAGDVNVFYSH